MHKVKVKSCPGRMHDQSLEHMPAIQALSPLEALDAPSRATARGALLGNLIGDPGGHRVARVRGIGLPEGLLMGGHGNGGGALDPEAIGRPRQRPVRVEH